MPSEWFGTPGSGWTAFAPEGYVEPRELSADVVVVGGGHNSLVASTYLARAGLDVLLLERLDHVGGAAVSAQTFPEHDARLSRYSYLVSLMPQALVDDLGLRLELRSRDTASYTPYERDGEAHGLLVETDAGDATRASFRELTGSDDAFEAWQAFYGEVATLADAVAPTFLRPLPRRADLGPVVDQQVWTDVVEQPLGVALERRFDDDLVRGVVGTDGLIGTFASLHDPSLAQNRCFLYHLVGNGTGEWRVPVGGMGAVTGELERVAREAGVRISTGTTVTSVHPVAEHEGLRDLDDFDPPEPAHVNLDAKDADGQLLVEAQYVLSGIAPHALDPLMWPPRPGDQEGPTRPTGSQLKINLLVSRLPRLRSGDDPAVAFAGTFHVDEAMSQVEALHAAAAQGEQPFASGELYCHTLTDRSILGPELAASEAQTLTYFGLHTPYENLLDDGAAEREYRRFLTAIDAHLAEPLEPLVLGVEVKTPADVEAALAMPGGHIFHGDLAWPWLEDDEAADSPAQRWGVATAHDRVLLCGSGARRGGAVSGIGGHNAAHALLELLGRRP
ncbi:MULTISPECIES: NAD(P)/FAD-dependent oxidoreductase [unclassified Aeromicrobium]|uniref:phytoene desaturase family protein n=1 Tax=unclassified Aeromicrobium TaxID=2633570 RepID=UPI00288A38C8|nr:MULTISPECIES: NAD(P)/FAD-dependent oxidoreductase [unclassified Aeromicrobium]